MVFGLWQLGGAWWPSGLSKAVGFTRQMTGIAALLRADDFLSLATRSTNLSDPRHQSISSSFRAPIVFGSIIMAFISPVILWFLVAILTATIVFMSRLMPSYAKIRQPTDQLVNLTREQPQLRVMVRPVRFRVSFRNRNELYKPGKPRRAWLAVLWLFLTVNGNCCDLYLLIMRWLRDASGLVTHLLQIFGGIACWLSAGQFTQSCYISAGRISGLRRGRCPAGIVQETALPSH